jgi:hypothetical protein
MDPVELARNVRPLTEREWYDINDGLVFVTCGQCGETHSLEIKETGPNMQRIRIVVDQDATDACREYTLEKYPLYREVIRLREENINLKRQVEENGK